MASSSPFQDTPVYRPALAYFAAFGSAWVFVLVMLGAFTTSIGAGMAFADWPLSNGSLNPHGWLDNVAMFAEHSHRLSAGIMSTITVVLAVWIVRTDSRSWLRKLAVFAVALVLIQALVGGLRVLLDHHQVELVNTSVGRLFAMLHACLAQLFACTLIAIALSCSRFWITTVTPTKSPVRRAGLICCGLLFMQLAIAAVMRHSFAGLAIPTFPFSTAEGGILPAVWDFRVAIHFAHRLMAAVLAVGLGWFVFTIRRDRGALLGLRLGASGLVSLVVLQILLGAEIIWTQRSATMTTGHVVVGAMTLVLTFSLTWIAHRDQIEQRFAA